MPIALGPFPPRHSGEAPASHHGYHPRILYIDAFDSFSNNIIGLLQQSIGATVVVARINDIEVSQHLTSILNSFDAVVVGPGPGHPANATDVGLIGQLWQLQESDQLPIFGVCLGFQSLCRNHDATIEKLQRARHGIVSKIEHQDGDMFDGIRNLHATQYHSLHVRIGKVTAAWDPTPTCPFIQPLAWDLSDEINGPILMAAKHTHKPYWGVQFHPESICTSEEGLDMMRNWWHLAQEWSTTRQRIASAATAQVETILGRLTSSALPGMGSKHSVPRHGLRETTHAILRKIKADLASKKSSYAFQQLVRPWITPVLLCELLRLDWGDLIMLDSQGDRRGRFSIVGVPIAGKTPRLKYRTTNKLLCYVSRVGVVHSVTLDSISQVWPVFEDALDTYRSAVLPKSDQFPELVPFWGGFMGYISYEAGLETIDVKLRRDDMCGQAPDINFAFIERSVVVDHRAGQIYVQSILPNDEDWVTDTITKLQSLRYGVDARPEVARDLPQTERDRNLYNTLSEGQWYSPREATYRNKVRRCQDFLAQGESYELCLTDQTEMCLRKMPPWSEWDLYKRLRSKNPAPHGAVFRFGQTTILSSSPERFLRWDRKGLCQLRPIKGTVKKGLDMSQQEAHRILNSSKERAENLMIVDLVRHDLSGVVGAENVTVPKCMVVEEYETVYQLVSVIEGQLPAATDDNSATPTGLDVLKASLPPGSMTGAPKKRSCEILQDIEKRPRGIYSGVLGYMDIGGGGDFSVVIRTAVKQSEISNAQHDAWQIGAGGAITIQSDDKAEFLEMETKLKSALGAFVI